MEKTCYEVQGEYYPKFVKKDGKYNEITWVHEKYVSTRLKIHCFESNGIVKLNKVELNSRHPNADPRTKELCLPDELKDLKHFDINTMLPFIENMIIVFNLDSSYYNPIGDYRFKCS